MWVSCDNIKKLHEDKTQQVKYDFALIMTIEYCEMCQIEYIIIIKYAQFLLFNPEKMLMYYT